MNKRIKKKKRSRENKELREFCKMLKTACENLTFYFSSVPNSDDMILNKIDDIKYICSVAERNPDKLYQDKKVIDINKKLFKEDFSEVAGSNMTEKEMSQSMTVTLPESDLKVEIVKDRYSPYVSWKGIPPHLRLAALYNAAYPTQMKMTDDEAAMYLHNCMGEVRRINGKNLYIDNIFDDVIDSTQYNIHHGHQMMQQVLSNLRKRLYENWEKGIPVDGFPNVDASIPEDAIDEIRKEAKAVIDDILGLSKEK